MGQPNFFCCSDTFVQFRTPVQFEYQVSNGQFLGKIYPLQYLGHTYTKSYSFLFFVFFLWHWSLTGCLESSLAALVDEPLPSGPPLLGSLWAPMKHVWAFSVFPGSVQISKYLAAKCPACVLVHFLFHNVVVFLLLLVFLNLTLFWLSVNLEEIVGQKCIFLNHGWAVSVVCFFTEH